jgi:microcystin degradation protein MlrC
VFHETHSFLDDLTRLDDFQVRRERELLSAEADGSPLGGVLTVARQCGWDVIPAIDMRATPSGIVEDRVVQLFWRSLKDVIDRESRRGFDGALLVLHGAMVSQTCADVEGHILGLLRQMPALRGVPLCGVLDLHANVSPEMAAPGEAFLAYQHNPHTDAEAAGMRAARLLDRVMQTGERPETVWVQPDIVWPPTGVGTGDDPMKTLEAMARDVESECADILAVNVFAGFAFADTLNTGVSFTAVTLGDPEMATQRLARLSDWAVTHQSMGNVVPPQIDSVMPEVLAQRRGPVILVEPSENIGGGAPGDGTGVLRALLKFNVDGGVVVINDPAAVKVCSERRRGDHVTLDIGGKASSFSGDSVELAVEIIGCSDGKFELEDRNSHLASMCGSSFEMGPCAVVRHGGIQILLTSKRTPPFDLAQLRSQGIEPEAAKVIGVKAAVAHRRAYDPIAAASYTVATPGVCSSDLRSFPYQGIRRPIYPLDER